MIMNKNNGKLEESILKSIEQYLEYNLPKDYRTFLLNHNGGETQKKIFLFKNAEEDGSILDYLLGIVPNRYENVLIYLKNYKDRIPNNTFPIGYDPGGNLILISVKGTDRGKIYFWDHEMEADPAQGEEPTYDNLTLIADSFDEFINNLKEE